MGCKRLHILLIEDNLADADLIRQMLAEVEDAPVDVECVSRLSTGLERYARGGMGLVLLDLSLPDSQGLETLHVMHARFPEAPIVVLTGLNDAALAINALHEGAQDYLVKCQSDSTSLMRSIRYAVERKRVEEELQFRNAILCTQLELCPDGILVVDEQRTIIHYNRRFVDLWQVPLEVMESRSDKRVLQALSSRLADPQQFLARVNYLYEHREEKSEEEIALQNGETYERHSAPMFGPNGRYYGRVWFFRDITRRRQAAETVKKSEEKYRSLVETTSDWVWEVDENGVFTYVSPKVRDILGYEPAEVLGKTLFDLMPPDEAKRIFEVFSRVTASHAPFHGLENMNIHKDGRTVQLETNGVPVFDSCGIFSGYRGIDRDITERKRAQQALAHQMQELERFNRLAVGREQRMIELKRQVNDLAQQLGRPPPYDLSFLQEHGPKGSAEGQPPESGGRST